MTSNSGRGKKKYNPLNKHGTIAIRRDFIEDDYVNGVFNAQGEQVIRPLNAAELEFLSQFYAETEHGNFAKTEEIEAMQTLYTMLSSELNHAKKNKLTTEQILDLRDRAEKAYKELVQLRSETNTFYPEDKDRRVIFKKGYDRREDIFNVAKSSGALISYDLPEFDKFSSKAEKDINPEHLVLDYLTRTSAKKKMPRKKKRLE